MSRIQRFRLSPGTPRGASLALALVLLISTVTMPLVASAKFLGGADWQGGKRTLKVKNVANDPWKTWMKEAMANWNAKSAETGWTLEEAGPTEAGDVGFVVDSPHTVDAKGNAHQCGGANITGFGKSPLTKLTIHVDEDCTDQEFRAAGGGHSHPSGGEGGKGWGKSGATTLDPVLVLKHELSHALRLDHSPSGGTSTGNLEDPIGLGYHGRTTGSVEDSRTPSADDVLEAKEASTGVVAHNHKIVALLGDVVEYAGAVVEIPPGALTEPADVGIRALPLSGIPDATSVGDVGHVAGSGIFQAYEFAIAPEDMAFDVPVRITMHWDDAMLDGGYFLGDTHGMPWEGGSDSKIDIFWYNPSTRVWEKQGATCDRVNNVCTIYVTHFSLYGLGLSEPDPFAEPEVVPASSPLTLLALVFGGIFALSFVADRRSRASR